MKGRRRTPQEVKRLRGTARPDRAPPAPALAPDALSKLPLPPATLRSAPARAAWREYGARLIAQGSLTSADLILLEDLCEIVHQLQDVRAFLKRAGSPTYTAVTSRGARIVRPFPQVAMEKELSRRLATRLADFGLTPGSRPRPPVAATPQDPMNEFLNSPA